MTRSIMMIVIGSNGGGDDDANLSLFSEWQYHNKDSICGDGEELKADGNIYGRIKYLNKENKYIVLNDTNEWSFELSI